MIDADMKEGLDSLLEAAVEGAPEWKEDILGFVEDDLYSAADKEMKEAGTEEEDERDAVKAVVASKALYLAYVESLENIEDADARDYLRARIEGTATPSAGALATAVPLTPPPAAPRLTAVPAAPTLKPPTLK